MLYITGDIHGSIQRFDKNLFISGRYMTKEDYVVILGDFGLVWNYKEESLDEARKLEILDNYPWTTLFIDGNHENFDRLLKYPEKKMFGGTVGVLRPSVLHLKTRGGIYNIPDTQQGIVHKCWCFGGAHSIDKNQREDKKTWWKQELPTDAEYKRGLKTLAENNFKVDYIFTHEGPYETIKWSLNIPYLTQDKLKTYLDKVKEQTTFKHWYFGHHHLDRRIEIGDKHITAMYIDIEEMGERKYYTSLEIHTEILT